MFSGLFIAFSIWKYGYIKWRAAVDEGTAPPGFAGYLGLGVSAFRDDFINTGDNDIEVGRWWDVLIYVAFPVLFFILMASYFSDMIANTPNVWDPKQSKGLSIILLFWGVVAALFIALNEETHRTATLPKLCPGADADISQLPGGSDKLIGQVGGVIAGFEHLSDSIDAELAD